MKRPCFFSICLVIYFAFSITACDWTPTDNESFYYDLQETWVSEEGNYYKGEIKITMYSIRITGYGETQTPKGKDDSQRPFKDIDKGVNISGYSEETEKKSTRITGIIYFEDYKPEGIPYELRVYVDGYTKTKILEFDFGGRKEILKVKEKKDDENDDGWVHY